MFHQSDAVPFSWSVMQLMNTFEMYKLITSVNTVNENVFIKIFVSGIFTLTKTKRKVQHIFVHLRKLSQKNKSVFLNKRNLNENMRQGRLPS